VGLLPRPSNGPKLPLLLWAALLSLPPLALCRFKVRTGLDGCSWGTVVVPMGVARWRVGRAGRGGGAAGFPTGFAFGDGGMARPRRGARPPGREPGMAGRSSGGAADIMGTLMGGWCGIPREGCNKATKRRQLKGTGGQQGTGEERKNKARVKSYQGGGLAMLILWGGHFLGLRTRKGNRCV
jgi:hypothetical protein